MSVLPDSIGNGETPDERYERCLRWYRTTLRRYNDAARYYRSAADELRSARMWMKEAEGDLVRAERAIGISDGP